MNNGTCFEIVWHGADGQWHCQDAHPYIWLALLTLMAVALVVVILTWRKKMAALDDLNANIATLNTTIASAVTALGNTGVPQAAVEGAATAVAQANSTLAAAIPPAQP